MNLIKMTSISKKVLLASVGSFLIIFLLLHLAINLCLLRGDGGTWFIAASHFMGTNYIIKAFEIVLFLALFMHICLAVLLQIKNWRSRPVRYKVCTKSKTSFMSKNMIWTGGLVLCFLAIHFMNFYFVKLGWADGKAQVEIKHINEYLENKYSTMENQDEAEQLYTKHVQNITNCIQKGTRNKTGEAIMGLNIKELKEAVGPDFKNYEPDFYTMSIDLFKSKTYSFIYIFLFIALGFHLYHAFRSAFQTFGLNHSKYNCTIKTAGLLYAIIISVGFSIIPIYFLITNYCCKA